MLSYPCSQNIDKITEKLINVTSFLIKKHITPFSNPIAGQATCGTTCCYGDSRTDLLIVNKKIVLVFFILFNICSSFAQVSEADKIKNEIKTGKFQ